MNEVPDYTYPRERRLLTKNRSHLTVTLFLGSQSTLHRLMCNRRAKVLPVPITCCTHENSNDSNARGVGVGVGIRLRLLGRYTLLHRS